MRSFVLVLLVLAASSFAFASKPVTVQELTDTLSSMHQSNKTDDEVATRLKQMQLSEELTSSAAESLVPFLPGPLSTEQLEILRSLSAFLPPPPQSPAPPPPDAAAQGAILAHAGAWLAGDFNQTPTFTASKIVMRFQDNEANTSTMPGLQLDMPNTYTAFSQARTDTVESTQGVEKVVASTSPKTRWGENGQISDGGPIPPLPELFKEASASGKLSFTRWETVNNKPAAVFTFEVDKKKSRYNVEYCCFPSTDTATGVANSGAMVAPNDIQSVTTWRPFKKGVPYHGQLYIDPATGAILRTVTFAELKPSEYVHTENVRIDYSEEIVNGKTCIVPLRSITFNETVPGGDTGTRGYHARHALFTATYGNYRIGATQ